MSNLNLNVLLVQQWQPYKNKDSPKESVASCTTVHVGIGYDCCCVTNWISGHILLSKHTCNTIKSVIKKLEEQATKMAYTV